MSETVSDGPFSGPRPPVWMVECGGTAACLGAEQDRHPASVISGEAAEEEVTHHTSGLYTMAVSSTIICILIWTETAR